MDVNTRSPSRSVARGKARIVEGYTVYFLSLDGTIATVKKNFADDDTVQVTVEFRDRQAERTLSAEVAQNPRSAEFVRVVREMKSELAARAKARRRFS